MQDVAPGTMCLNCISYGDILEESYLEQLEAAPNHHLEPTNDDLQDDVESNESSSNRSFDANWDATVYANAYASEKDSEDDSEGDSDSISNLSFSDGTSDNSDSSSNSSFSDSSSDRNSDGSDDDTSDDDDSELSSDGSSISLEGEIALNVDQDAFCVINPNSDEVSEDENTENGNDNNFYSIIKYVLEGAITTFYSEKYTALWTVNDVIAKKLWKYPKGVFTAFEGSF
jgi:hypothetical protein